MGNNRFDLLSLGEILLRLSPPDNERIVSGAVSYTHLFLQSGSPMMT